MEFARYTEIIFHLLTQQPLHLTFSCLQVNLDTDLQWAYLLGIRDYVLVSSQIPRPCSTPYPNTFGVPRKRRITSRPKSETQTVPTSVSLAHVFINTRHIY